MDGAIENQTTVPQEVTVGLPLDCNSCTKPVTCHCIPNTALSILFSVFSCPEKGRHICMYIDTLECITRGPDLGDPSYPSSLDMTYNHISCLQREGPKLLLYDTFDGDLGVFTF